MKTRLSVSLAHIHISVLGSYDQPQCVYTMDYCCVCQFTWSFCAVYSEMLSVEEMCNVKLPACLGFIEIISVSACLLLLTLSFICPS